MNSQAKAAKVIDRHGFDPCREPECIAQDLADAGLLAPDLPEPDEEGRFIVGQRAIWVDSSGVLCIEARGLDGYAATDGAAIPIGEAAEARKIAAALLAAAQHQEKE